jgi:hypothetical protein
VAIWRAGALARKDIGDFRREEAFRRRQPDIHARYVPAAAGTAVGTAAQTLNTIALEQARKIIGDMPPRQQEIALTRWQRQSPYCTGYIGYIGCSTY